MKAFNLYCDESCHLDNDHQQVMILGALSCPTELSRSIAKQIRAIKAKHDLSPTFEIKWTKVSPGKLDFYTDLLDYFFAENHLLFRAVIIPDKTILCHNAFKHDHDTWYYKMYYELLKVMLNPQNSYQIYLDIKDTRSGEKVAKLHDVLCNNALDFERQVVKRIQNVHSHEIEQVQLADLLIGCVLAANKNDNTSFAKRSLVEKMCDILECSLTHSTPLWQKKVNLFRWTGREVNNGS
jgi:hypothetical protein